MNRRSRQHKHPVDPRYAAGHILRGWGAVQGVLQPAPYQALCDRFFDAMVGGTDQEVDALCLGIISAEVLTPCFDDDGGAADVKVQRALESPPQHTPEERARLLRHVSGGFKALYYVPETVERAPSELDVEAQHG